MINPIKFWPRGNSMVIELSGLIDRSGQTIADAQVVATMSRRAAAGTLEAVPGQQWPLQLLPDAELGPGVFIGIPAAGLELDGVETVYLVVTATSGDEVLNFREWKVVKDRAP